jgi:ATP-binding cassette subfamily B protein/ATP-binding cassette subfamily C protein
VALVGPSGAGKSTVLALIERFYDATDGSIRLQGVDLRDLPRAVLRARIGYVEQDAPVLAGTIRDNLLMFQNDATDARLLEVLDTVNLTDLVTRARDGLDTQVGDDGVANVLGARVNLRKGTLLPKGRKLLEMLYQMALLRALMNGAREYAEAKAAKGEAATGIISAPTSWIESVAGSFE